MSDSLAYSDLNLLGTAGNVFQAAAKNNRPNQKQMTNSDFQKVQRGEMEVSNKPRATKRRALMMCKDGQARALVPLDSGGYIQERECIQRVMDGDYDFMLKAAEKK